MNILGHDCGCDERRDILLNHGELTPWHAVIPAVLIVILYAAWKAGRT